MMNQNGFDYIASPSEFARSNYFYALIGGLSVTDKRFYFERAYYPAYEILLISQGKGWFLQGDEWLGLVAGDCLLHDMRYPHAYKSDPEHPFEMRYLVFDGYSLDKMWTDFFNAPHVLFHLETSDGLAVTIDSVLSAMLEDSDPDRSELRISCLVYQLILQCLRDSRIAGRQNAGPKPDAMIEAQRFLNKRYLDIENMEEAAKKVNLSYYHFIRQFRRYYGCTPKEYVLLKRVHHAKRLILLTNRSITEIAGLSGFNNYNSFRHAFHQIERCSPTDYRRNWKLYE